MENYIKKGVNNHPLSFIFSFFIFLVLGIHTLVKLQNDVYDNNVGTTSEVIYTIMLGERRRLLRGILLSPLRIVERAGYTAVGGYIYLSQQKKRWSKKKS